jgi:hypothetical protein
MTFSYRVLVKLIRILSSVKLKILNRPIGPMKDSCGCNSLRNYMKITRISRLEPIHKLRYDVSVFWVKSINFVVTIKPLAVRFQDWRSYVA